MGNGGKAGGVTPRRRSVAIYCAFGAFAAANLIHNDFGLDAAVAPAALLVALYSWRPNRGLLWGAAFVIAFPAFAFLQLRALAETGDVARFLNHWALFVAGAFAVLSVLLDTVTRRIPVRAG